jgi:anti-sigma regulatory factor (Ser/Thr protein kinase)
MMGAEHAVRAGSTADGRGQVSADAVELLLSGGLEDVPRARAFTRQALAGAPDAVTDDAVTVVTELVTNALLHGGPPVRLRVTAGPDGVRLEVADGGAEVPVVPRRSSVAMTGRGLALVDALSARGAST